MEQMVKQVNEQAVAEGKEPFQLKTVSLGAATSVRAAVIAPAEEVGRRYCETYHVSDVVAEDARLGLLTKARAAMRWIPGTPGLSGRRAKRWWARPPRRSRARQPHIRETLKVTFIRRIFVTGTGIHGFGACSVAKTGVGAHTFAGTSIENFAVTVGVEIIC
jgi:hypothetical protein